MDASRMNVIENCAFFWPKMIPLVCDDFVPAEFWWRLESARAPLWTVSLRWLHLNEAWSEYWPVGDVWMNRQWRDVFTLKPRIHRWTYNEPVCGKLHPSCGLTIYISQTVDEQHHKMRHTTTIFTRHKHRPANWNTNRRIEPSQWVSIWWRNMSHGRQSVTASGISTYIHLLFLFYRNPEY